MDAIVGLIQWPKLLLGEKILKYIFVCKRVIEMGHAL